MNKTKKYLIVEKTNLLEMNTLINELLNNGWKLYGNLTMVYAAQYENNHYAQAMVKYKNES